MSLRDRLRDADLGEVLMADGFDEAFVGVGRRCGQPPIAVYDRERCLQVLVEREEMTPEEAEEWMSVNAEGAWVGSGTPIFVEKLHA